MTEDGRRMGIYYQVCLFFSLPAFPPLAKVKEDKVWLVVGTWRTGQWGSPFVPCLPHMRANLFQCLCSLQILTCHTYKALNSDYDSVSLRSKTQSNSWRMKYEIWNVKYANADHAVRTSGLRWWRWRSESPGSSSHLLITCMLLYVWTSSIQYESICTTQYGPISFMFSNSS
jgi:hypothetical protein